MKESDRKGSQPNVPKPKDLEAEIIKLNNEGLGLTAIARKLGISRGSVYGVITRAREKSAGPKTL